MPPASRVRMDKTLQVTHLKRWTPAGLAPIGDPSTAPFPWTQPHPAQRADAGRSESQVARPRRRGSRPAGLARPWSPSPWFAAGAAGGRPRWRRWRSRSTAPLSRFFRARRGIVFAGAGPRLALGALPVLRRPASASGSRCTWSPAGVRCRRRRSPAPAAGEPGCTVTAPVAWSSPAPARPGLSAAHELSVARRGRASCSSGGRAVGGIARTETYNGYRFDIGGHRFLTKSARGPAAVGSGAGRRVHQASSACRGSTTGRRFFDYPIKPVERRRAISARGERAASSPATSRARIPPMPARADVRGRGSPSRFGRRLYETFFKTYTEKVWGMPGSEIPRGLGRAAHQGAVGAVGAAPGAGRATQPRDVAGARRSTIRGWASARCGSASRTSSQPRAAPSASESPSPAFTTTAGA